MLHNKTLTGHAAALLSIVVWGTTFISTKVLLQNFSPLEIFFFRFCIGYAALWCVTRRPLHLHTKSHEIYFAAAGLCGATLYFLMENFALMFTQASNVSVMVSLAPFFTVLFQYVLFRDHKPAAPFFLGFLMAIAGIYLMSFRGKATISINPTGDLLAMGAAIVWAAYSILSKKISSLQYPTVLATRRIFFYGLLFSLPLLPFMEFRFAFERFHNTIHLLNILFLGLGASALCYVTWNFSVKVLGTVKTSVYIYMVPVITVITSIIILQETITQAAWAGICLTIAGLFLSQYKSR